MPMCLPLMGRARRLRGLGALALSLLLPLLVACGGPYNSNLNTTLYVGSTTGGILAIDAGNGAVLWRYQSYGVMGMAIDPDHHALFMTSHDGTVTRVDATTGHLDWSSAIGGGDWMNKPYLVGSMVVAVSQQAPGGPPGASVIAALNAKSGATLWRESLPGAIAGDLDIHTDRIYASVNTASAKGGPGPGVVYALRTADGAQVWRVTPPVTPPASPPASLVAAPVSDQTQVYAPTSLGSVFALRASDGLPLWSQNISASGALSALFASSTAIYVGDSGRTLRALSKADGAVLWTRAIADNRDIEVVPTMEIFTPSDGGAAVLLTSATAPVVDALSPRDGSLLWSEETPAFGGITQQPPFVEGSNVYLILAPGDEIDVLSLANGAVVADYPFGLHSERYTPAEQTDLQNIACVVAA